MSRHRSPGGRQQGGRAAPPRHRATAVARRGMTAAAAGSALIAVIPPGVVAVAEADTAIGGATAEITMLASITPVREVPEPAPPEMTANRLIKAAGLADVVRKAEEAKAARRAAADCDADLSGLGPVKPWARSAARFLSCLFDHPTLLGVGGRGGVSDHPLGLAVDFMTGRERGDRIAACALANRRELGISYVIWRQRINFGDGWQAMEDRGSITENHYDHVHVSFEPRASGGRPDAVRCG
ncbi:hypothetical protein [Pseudonocardia sp. GCM10023141]|uniref:hypothetical protein n=1 Tax=Pseudonocardia sp. GCM10023141 TaxID=3252653 RepID=UPI0036110F47